VINIIVELLTGMEPAKEPAEECTEKPDLSWKQIEVIVNSN